MSSPCASYAVNHVLFASSSTILMSYFFRYTTGHQAFPFSLTLDFNISLCNFYFLYLQSLINILSVQSDTKQKHSTSSFRKHT